MAAEPVASEELLEFLERPKSYPHPTTSVERIETHISWVFLTDTEAYKFKKPVRFEFLDFSTAELRRAACEAEVRLNRRLAGDVYLGVVAVSRAENGQLEFEGTGTPLEYGVRMRRLPAEHTLDRLIHGGNLTEKRLEPLAEHLTRFYCNAAPLVLSADTYRAGIEQHVRANQAELADSRHGFDPRLVQRVHAAQLQVLRLRADWFIERVCDGRIIDGHGDLRPEHICLGRTQDEPPAVFDCLEFNDEFRRIDVADELAFLGMECDFLGAHEVGTRLWKHYAAQASDHPPAPLLEFYRAYRACVRAKVAALRGEQLAGEDRRKALHQSTEYLRLADRYTAPLGPPLLLVVRGLAGSGKSTLAGAVAETLGASVLSTDTLRNESPPVKDRYSLAARHAVYQRLLERASDLLSEGLSVVLDGTFLRREWREQALMLGRRHGAHVRIFRCECSPNVARERITARLAAGGSDSEARPELLDIQQREEEPDAATRLSSKIDSTLALAAQVELIEQALGSASGLSGPDL